MTEARHLASSHRIGVDIGGTFTDLVTVDHDGVVRTAKSLSTPAAPERGVFAVLRQAAGQLGISTGGMLQAADALVHGTTVSTNALVQRKGARVGVIFTHGFEDTLSIGRGPTGRVGGLPPALAMDFLHTEPPQPLVPPSMVRGVPERTGADGRIIVPLNEARAEEAIQDLLGLGAESLAVCLLWSFREDRHERILAEIAARLAPDIPVSLSHRIAPRMGEFERAVTTVVNAYVAPVTRTYLRRLDTGLSENGFDRPIQIMTSRGGAARLQTIDQEAGSIINSGPTGGLLAARYLGDSLGHDRIITADMGGTTFDVGLIDGGFPEEESRPFLDQGLPSLLPAIKVVSIGAGGGSIARTDGYRLHVGPQSAGADPGPAAYGRGGLAPTVTDALVVCGMINPRSFFDGNLPLDPDRALRAIRDRIAEPLGMPVLSAAAGIVEVVNAQMANLIRNVSIQSGHDPRNFVLYAFGGATGAHCADLARHLGLPEIVLPFAGPVFSALGIAIADIVYSRSRTEPVLHGIAATDVVNRNFRTLRTQVEQAVRQAGLDVSVCRFDYRIEMRYRSQMNEITVDWPGNKISSGDMDRLRDRFEAQYQRRFGAGTTRSEAPLELISFRVDATHPTRKPALARLPNRTSNASGTGTRKVYTRASGWIEAAVHDFQCLSSGTRIDGPAIIERDTTTVWVPSDACARLDAYGNLIMARETQS